MEQSQARESASTRWIDIVLIVRTRDPVRLREEVEALDWQMPLAPFVADDVTLEVLRGRARKRTRSDWKPGQLYGGQHGHEDRTEA